MRVMMMALLYEPEFGAAVRRIASISESLARSGHSVYVITGMPNYPAGKVYPGYEGKWFMREEINGVHVIRTRYYMVPRNVSKFHMLLSYFSFLPALIIGSIRAPAVDFVFVTSPPLFNVLPAILMKWWKRAKLVVDLRDLWPDEFVAFGAAKETSLFVRSLRVLERWGYRSSSLVVCTTRAIMDTVSTRGADREKLVFVPNGAEVNFFRPMARENSVTNEYNLGDKFVVCYSGLLGLKFGLEMLIDVAQHLSAHLDVVLFIRGDGPLRETLVSQVADRKLQNVVFGGERPLEDIPYLLARADVCVSCLLPDQYLDKIISVKLFDYLSCERPVVAAVGGESGRLISESGGGIVVAPGDAEGMAKAILSLKGDPERRRQMGEAGRRFVCANFAREVAAENLEKALVGLMPPSTSAATAS